MGVTATAASVGVAEKTLRRWLADPGFSALYRETCRQILEAGCGQLTGLYAQAVAALGRNLASGIPAVEVKTAAIVLEQALRATEFLHLQAELAELTAQVEAFRTKGGGTAP